MTISSQAKLEARNPKFETNSNDQKHKNFKQRRLSISDFPLHFVSDIKDCNSNLSHLFVSDFDIRISDLSYGLNELERFERF